MPCLERLDCKLNLPVLLTKLSNHNQVRKRPWQQDNLLSKLIGLCKVCRINGMSKVTLFSQMTA
jgi:hypothetical protein